MTSGFAAGTEGTPNARTTATTVSQASAPFFNERCSRSFMAGSFEFLDGRRAVGDVTVKAFGADILLVADPCSQEPGAERPVAQLQALQLDGVLVVHLVFADPFIQDSRAASCSAP